MQLLERNPGQRLGPQALQLRGLDDLHIRRQALAGVEAEGAAIIGAR